MTIRIIAVCLIILGLASLPRVAAQTPPLPTLEEMIQDARISALETVVASLVTSTPTGTPESPTATLVPIPEPPTATVVPSPSPALPTSTPTLSPTVEPTATVVVSTPVIDTPTPAPPTATPAVVAGQECPAWVHNRVTTTGPDGATYPTWHPPVDAEYGCWYAHEHGDDPRISRANSSLPAFGYIGNLVGDAEPHPGFKVFVQNAGSVNEDGRTLAHDSRLVVHMGTSGPARFVVRFHSLQFDTVARDGSGHEAHVMGMADTFAAGSICQSRQDFPKTVMVLPGLCHTDSPYEIWSTRMRVGTSANGYRFEVNSSWGVFDPITIMDPADPTRLLLMSTYYPAYGSNPVGAKREGYACPCYYANGTGGGLSTFRTDAYGVALADGPLVQTVSRHNDLGVTSMYVVQNSSDVQSQAKLQSYHQNNSRLRSPN